MRRMIKFFIFVALFIFLLDFSFSGATTYYVSLSGSNSNPGNFDQPWRTIQYAANNISSGDTLYVMNGNYDEYVAIPNKAGNSSLRTLAILPANNVSLKGFDIRGNNIRIEGFEITNTSGSTLYGAGIWIRGNNSQIVGNYIHHTYGNGIINWPFYGSRNNSIINNTLYKTRGSAITVFENTYLIEGNNISRTTTYWPGEGFNSSFDADGIRLWGDGHIVRNNHVHNILLSEAPTAHADCLQTWDMQGRNLTNLVFERNYCFNIPGQFIQIEAFSHGSANLTFRNNIFQFTSGAGMNLHGGVNVSFYNNLFINNGTGGSLLYSSNSRGGIVVNNIFFNTSIDWSNYDGNSTVYGDYNIFYPNKSYYKDHPVGLNDKRGIDPLFVNPEEGDFRLREDSPALNNGMNLSAFFNEDFTGAPRQGETWDIGPYEYYEESIPVNDSQSENSTNFTDSVSPAPDSIGEINPGARGSGGSSGSVGKINQDQISQNTSFYSIGNRSNAPLNSELEDEKEENKLILKEIEKIIEEENINEAFNTQRASYAKVILYGFLGMVFLAIVIVGFLIIKIVKGSRK